jgi:predicted helicase
VPRIFPHAKAENTVIHITGIGVKTGFSALITEKLPNFHNVDTGQCFPLYLYEETKPEEGLFATADGETGFTRREAITDDGLTYFQAAYPGEAITKEDLFYYIYGLLHAPDYRERFKNNLSKALPRIPAVRTFADFSAFRDAGRRLGDLHVNFESVEPYLVTFKEGDHALINEAQDDPLKFYRVKKMKFGGKGKDKDKTTVIYNDNITMQNIPLEAYDYVVNGKPALEWVMERQVVKQDKASGIVNDANDYANETIGDPRYPLDLFRRVITVSLETMRIMNGLPKLDIEE